LARRARPVFINCPFDEDYRPLFRAMIFTLVHCGFKPRCALEVIDGAATRISKIEKLIEDCPLGIHDISRTELDAANALPRFNMPLELGLFLGAKRYGGPAQKRKKCLVLDVERFRYQKFMSDIAGQDIEAHGGDARLLIDRVRAFLNSAVRGAPLSSGAVIAADYALFTERLPETCAGLKVDPAALEYKDFTYVAAGWVEAGEMGGAML
jgi:hypothetical protein